MVLSTARRRAYLVRRFTSLVTAIAPLAFIACILLISCPLMAGDAPMPQMAPVNPAFTEFLLHKQFMKAAPSQTHGLGLIPSPVDRSHLTGGNQRLADQSLLSLPSMYDLRTTGRLTPVHDQGNCGSCWAFGAMASLESSLMPTQVKDFSENNLKNTNGFDYGPCAGGNADISTAYLMRWSGPVNETDDPYHDYDDTATAPTGRTVQKHAQNIIRVPLRSSSTDNNAIKAAITTHGALTASMYWDDGYYNAGNNAYHYNGAKVPGNHEIAIVGWDDTFDRNRFSPAAAGDGAFIMKNSWGTGWGENGFFYISYYDSVLGHEELAAFTTPETTGNYSSIYSHDPLGVTSGYGYGGTTAWFANIFAAQGNEKIAAVSFYNASLNSPYEVKVYADLPNSSTPVWDTPVASLSGTLPDAGYLTIPLASPIPVRSGQLFSVVVKLTTPGYSYPIPVEGNVSGYSSGATASPGQSFISSNGRSWTDTTTIDSTMNVCLKAYAAQPLTGVTLSAAPASPQIVGTPILFTASANGGTAPVRYQFLMRTPAGAWGTIQPYSTSTTFQWNTNGLAAGTYTIQVRARSAGSTAPYQAVAQVNYTLNLTPVTAVSFSNIFPTSPRLAGIPVYFQGRATGGVRPQYQFLVRTPTGVWSTAQGYSFRSAFFWDTRGLAAGPYVIQVRARSTGSTSRYEAVSQVNYTLYKTGQGFKSPKIKFDF